MKPIKVAQLCNFLADYGGNFIDSLRSIETAAAAENTPYESIFILPDGRRELEWIKDLQRNHKVYFISCKSKIAIARAVYTISRKEKVDIVHSHFLGCVELSLVRTLTKAKTIYHTHNPYIRKPNIIKESIRKFLQFISVDKFIGCSKATMDTLIAGGIPKKKCTYVTNRIDFSRFDAPGNEHPFNPAKTNLLIFGTHFIRKGCDLTLKALEPIAEKYNIVLNIVSHHSEQTKAEVKEILGYEPEWVDYPPTTESIGDYYKNAQFFLAPSREEGLSYGVIEALYCGSPLIKSDVPSMVYGLEGEDFISVPLTVEALRAKIEEMLTMDPARRQAMTASFRRQVIEKYSISAWGAEILQKYKELLR